MPSGKSHSSWKTFLTSALSSNWSGFETLPSPGPFTFYLVELIVSFLLKKKVVSLCCDLAPFCVPSNRVSLP